MKSNALKIDVEIIEPSLGIELTTTSAEVTGSPGSVFSFSFNIKNNYYTTKRPNAGAIGRGATGLVQPRVSALAL
jgi:hypothetical protein